MGKDKYTVTILLSRGVVSNDYFKRIKLPLNQFEDLEQLAQAAASHIQDELERDIEEREG